MPTIYENCAPYLRAGGVKDYANQTSFGHIYEYRGPTTTLEANKPAIGAIWADGKKVSDRIITPIGVASTGLSDLVVTTQAFVEQWSSSIAEPELEEEYEGKFWRPIERPLEMHPHFEAISDDDIEHVMGWRAEENPKLKSKFKYKPLIDGTPGETVTIADGSLAHDFCWLLSRGHEVYIDYIPVYRIIGIYDGSEAPETSDCGQKDTPPGQSGEWRKTADNVERYGRTTKWRRTQEWEGEAKVVIDRDEIFID